MFSQLYLLLTLTFLCSAVDFNCPNNDLGFYPVPDNCQMFVMCNFGFPVLQSCDAGLQFNPAIGLCDLPENVGCEDAAVAIGCPSPDGVYFLAHPLSCSKYVACSFGVPIELNCPEGYEFNSALSTCDLPENVECALA